MTEKNIRTNWKQECVVKTFLEAFLHEITLIGLKGTSLKPKSWKNVTEKLKTEHNFIVDQKQMKNHYDYLKSRFVAWSKQKNKTGNVYNPVTNTFNLPEEEWQIEIKLNKVVGSLRSTPLPFPELCVQLFEGSTSNGFDSWGPSSTLPRPSEEVSNHNLNDLENFECTQMDPPTQDFSEESSGQSREKNKVKETLIQS
ncbi:L10-interacting MYB domain-containing protein-like [Bidens hawaiensis]|uniref:L10-interacting MYB domain-containing protein-like n=1 Tax=Bidens hawaiensis TaxID=980011 RepID=UPI00404AD8A9